MLEIIELTTVNGYVATINPNLNYGQYLAIQEIMSGKMEVDPVTKTVTGSGSGIIAANRKAFELMLIKLINPEGVEVASPAVALETLPVVDGMEIGTKINELWSTVAADKKKGI